MGGAATAVFTLMGVALGGVLNVVGGMVVEQRRERALDRRERVAVAHELQDVCEEIVAQAMERGSFEHLALWEHRPEALVELESTATIERLSLTATKLAARAGHPEIGALTNSFLVVVELWNPRKDAAFDLTLLYQELVDGITFATSDD